MRLRESWRSCLAAAERESAGGRYRRDQGRGGRRSQQEEEAAEVVSDLETTITWWTYPIFVQDEGQEDGAYEQTLIQKFNEKYPNITVELKVLDYLNGPDEVQALLELESGELPNVLLDEPGRISSYAKAGVLADLGELFTEDVASDMVSEGILSACRNGDSYVMYPLSGSNYVMAFNRYMIEGSGAIELMNREGACTWTTEAFEQAAGAAERVRIQQRHALLLRNRGRLRHPLLYHEPL